MVAGSQPISVTCKDQADDSGDGPADGEEGQPGQQECDDESQGAGLSRWTYSDATANGARYASRGASVLVGVVALFDDGGGAEHVEGDGVAAGGLQGDAHGQALPPGGLADRDEVVGLGPLADLPLDYGVAGSQLRDDGEEASLGGVGGSAVGGIVAEPDGVRDDGVEVPQVQRGDVAGDAV